MDQVTAAKRAYAVASLAQAGHVGYDDIITPAWAGPDDLALLQTGHHFDYKAQVYVDGHDHAHYSPELDGESELLFCGADIVTCWGGDQ